MRPVRSHVSQGRPLAARGAGADAADPPVLGLPPVLFFLIGGAVLAPVFTFAPLLRRMGWLLCSLVHEIGHTAAALFVGCSAVPAIRLDGHAMTQHGPQHLPVALATWVALGFLAWRCRRRKPWLVTFAAMGLLYPLLAFTYLEDVVHLLGGHLGELVFAGIFFWRALSGGFTSARGERLAYATCAWYLVGCNLWLSAGLIFSVEVRHWYASSGSFGLSNDYIRLADQVLGWPLGAVAGIMLLASLAVLPVVYLICRRGLSGDPPDVV